MIDIVPYKSLDMKLWDHFVNGSKNGTFLFLRDYMDYHADKFKDNSLLFFKENKLIALLPANRSNNELISHGGLSYGGLIVDNRMNTPTMLSLFDDLLAYAKKSGIQKIVYKCIPYLYHQSPSDEDKYALFIHNAQLIRRDVTTCILQTQPLSYQERRSRSIKKALKNKIIPLESNSSEQWQLFWDLVTKNLQERYATNPVHTAEEILLLRSRFRDNIKLFLSLKDNNIVAGVVVFETATVAHIQYISASSLGKETGALDLLFDYLIKDIYSTKKYFDFGISNEQNGRVLNLGLIEQKEGFGARAIVHDFYEINIL